MAVAKRISERTWIAGALSLLGAALLSGCLQGGATGALEEEELYNTLGLAGRPLFDDTGLAPVARAAHPFVRAGLMWDAPAGTVLEGRVLGEDGRWSPWERIEPRWAEDIAHTGHLDVASGRADAFQLRLESGAAPSHLMAEAIAIVGEPALLSPEPRGEGEDSGYASLGQALGPASLVNSRSEWGARAPACNSGSHSPGKITIHHTATPLPDSVSPVQRLRQIQSYHIDTQGWCDIGYHFLVDWNGQLWQGRNETVIGAHVADNNTSNVGISFMGTYNSSSPTSDQMGHVAELVAWLSSQYGIPRDRAHLKGHREYRGNSPGDCPGDRIQSRLAELLDGSTTGGGDDSGGGTTTGGDATLQGVVFEDLGQGTADMSRRVPGATVQVAGGGSTTAREGDAYWSVQVSAGSATVSASAPGYRSASRTCSVAAGGSAWCSIGLTRDSGGTGGDTGGGGLGDVGAEPADPGGTGGDTGGTGGDTGGTGGDTGGTGGDTGGNTGGDTGGNTGGDTGGVQDPDLPRGVVEGYVVELNDEFDTLEGCEGPRVGGAEVSAETGETTVADASGHFEFTVLAGDRVLGAAADGYQSGAAECTVVEGGRVACCIHIVRDPAGGLPGDDGSPAGDPGEMGAEAVVVISCASPGAAGSAWLLFVLGLPLLLRRRT